VQRTEKERVVGELTERLRETESLLVADYRGLTNAQLAEVRRRLREHGATLTVVKNSLTRRAAEAAGAEQLLALLEGPTAIAFVESDGDAVAVAKALSDTARETKILALRGGVFEGKQLEASDVERLAKLPPVDVLKSQLVGVIIAPVTQLAGLLEAPLRDLAGLIDARIAQLEEQGGGAEEHVQEPVADDTADEAPQEPATAVEQPSAPDAEAEAGSEAEARPDTEAAAEAPSAEADTENETEPGNEEE